MKIASVLRKTTFATLVQERSGQPGILLLPQTEMCCWENSAHSLIDLEWEGKELYLDT